MKLTRFRIGQQFQGFPVKSWNELVEAVERLTERAATRPLGGPPPASGKRDHLTVLGQNKTGEPLKVFQVVKLSDHVLNLEQEHVRLGKPALELIKPTVGGLFGIVQQPIAEDDFGEVAFLGLSIVKLEVHDENAQTCGPAANDVTKLHTARSGCEIICQEEGLGEKWGLVLMGGGGSADAEVKRYLVTNILAGSWDAEQQLLTGGSALGYELIYNTDDDAGPIGWTPRLPYAVEALDSDFIAPITIEAGTARIGKAVGGVLLNLDCAVVEFTPAAPEE